MQNNIMVKKVALLIIYNHRYDKNIPLLETLYGERFTYLYHIIPFYDGTKDNVITVYDSSFLSHILLKHISKLKAKVLLTISLLRMT